MELQRIQFNPKISAAIRARDLPTLRKLFDEEPRQIATYTPFAGGTWLHFAAREGDIDAVLYLLSRGMDVNVGDAREGRTALCDACVGNHANVAEALLAAGAIIDTSESVRNPLFGAIVGRSITCARLLLDRGVDARVEYTGSSMQQMDATAFAVERGELEIAKLIAGWLTGGDTNEIGRLLDKAQQIAARNNAQR